MVPSKFEYTKVSSVGEAIKYLDSGEDVKVLAGGHSLIPTLKLRLSDPERLVDISQLPELRSINEADGVISIGAACTHYDIESSDLIKSKLSLFADVAGLIGDIQVRNKGTIGGSIAHADPAADWPAALLATDAVVVAQGPKGSRQIKAAGFFQGLFTTALEENEIITEVQVPVPGTGTSSAYAKFEQPASRFALVGCAVTITQQGGKINSARVAYTGVAGAAFRSAAVEAALVGQDANADTIAAAAAKATEGIDNVMSDPHAAEDYRRHLAKVFTKRALTSALE